MEEDGGWRVRGMGVVLAKNWRCSDVNDEEEPEERKCRADEGLSDGLHWNCIRSVWMSPSGLALRGLFFSSSGIASGVIGCAGR